MELGRESWNKFLNFPFVLRIDTLRYPEAEDIEGGVMVHEQPKTPLFNNAWYNRVKFVAMILLPALGSLYFGLAQIWGLPEPEKVVGTITLVDTFLGILLQISTNTYNNSDVKYDGQVVIEEVPGQPKRLTLELNSDPNDLENKEQIVFKVSPK